MKKLAAKSVPALLAGALLGYGAVGAADGIDINLNDDAALFRYIALDDRAGGAFGRREIDVGLLYTSDNDYLGMFGAQAIAEAGATIPELEAGVGVKLFGTRANDENFLALSLGGQIRYSVPPHRRIVLAAEGFYAPDVVTTSPADSFSYLALYLGYEVLPEALVYIGYRDISVDLDQGGDYTLDEGGHFGVRFTF